MLAATSLMPAVTGGGRAQWGVGIPQLAVFCSRVLNYVASLRSLGQQQPEGLLFPPLLSQALPRKLPPSYKPEIRISAPSIPAPSTVSVRNNETAAYRKEIQERKKKQVLFKPQTLG